MLHVDRRKRLQYGNMAENSGAEKTSSPLREILRKDRVLWWTVDAVLTIALVGGIWLAHKRIPFWWLQHKWIHFPSRARSEEHTSELQSLRHLVCRLLL